MEYTTSPSSSLQQNFTSPAATPEVYDPVWYDVLGFFVVFIGLTSLICNFCILILYKKIFPRPQAQLMNLPLISLTLSDIGICIHFPVILYSCIRRGWTLGTEICSYVAFFDSICSYSQIYMLTAIALERRRATSQSNTYRPSFRSSITIICVVWIISAVVSAFPLMGFGSFMVDGIGVSCTFNYIDNSTQNLAFVNLIVLFGFIIPIIIITYCHVVTIREVKRRTFKIQASKNASSAQSVATVTRREMMVIRITVRVVISFCISWIPYVLIALTSIYKLGPSPYLASLAGLFAKSSSTINAIVYVVSHQAFKKFLSAALAKESQPAKV